jgi:murein DD-endopeptidase MepM/ murein hydrolase activator NlpD
MLHVLGFDAVSRALKPLAWLLGGTVVFALSAAGGLTSSATEASGQAPLKAAIVTQGFGCTPVTLEPMDPDCPNRHFHSGIDLAAPSGTPVYSVRNGLATVVSDSGGYGIHVLVDSGGGQVELYGHLKAAAVAGGAFVFAGELVGWVGSTGNSTGPHLHFEVRQDGVPVNPSPWLPDYGGLNQEGGSHRWSTRSS